MKKLVLGGLCSLPLVLLSPMMAFAGEANLQIPTLSPDQNHLLYYRSGCLYPGDVVRPVPVHESQEIAGSPVNAGCGEHHLRDLQDLSPAAG